MEQDNEPSKDSKADGTAAAGADEAKSGEKPGLNVSTLVADVVEVCSFLFVPNLNATAPYATL